MTRLSRPIVAGLLFLWGFTGLVYALVWSRRLANLLGSSGHAHPIVLATFIGGLASGAWLFSRAAERVKRPLALFGVLELGVGVYALLFHFILEWLGSASLLLPTLLLGGSVPALTRCFTRGLGAIIFLGAGLGCLFAGVSLIPNDGLLASEAKAAALSLGLGAVAVLLALRTPASGGAPAEVAANGSSQFAMKAARIGVALSGFTATLYTITWIRVSSIVIGGTSYAATFTLTAFILGIGLGSAWLSRRELKSDALSVFARLQVLLVGTVCLALLLYGRMPSLFLNLHAALKKSITTWPVYQLLAFGLAIGVLMVPAFFLGASFRAAARVAPSRVANLGGTVGAVLGSLLGGLLLVPVLGLEGSFAVGLVCNLLAAGLAAWASRPAVKPLKHLWPVAAAVGGVIIYGASTIGGSGVVTSSGRSRASTDLDTQILAGHLGVLTHPGEARRVLLVGMGTGITAGALLSHPIDVLDVVDPVIDGARRFGDDPRCKVHLEDARTFLRRSPAKYDLIVSVPGDPWVDGVAGQLSRDFFQVASAHLQPGGRIVTWFHTEESSDALVRLALRTMRDTFAHGTSWGGPRDLVMLGTQEPEAIDFTKIEARMARPQVKADLLRTKTPDLMTLLGRQVHSDQGQLQFAGDGAINSDDRDRLEYDSPTASWVGDFVDVRDERRSPDRGSRLELVRYLQNHPLTAEEAQHVYASYAWVHGPSDSLVRAAAEQWAALAPESEDAALALANAAVAQRDVESALRILDARIETGSRRPEVVALWLEARARRIRRASAPYHPIDLGPALAIASEVLAANPGNEALQRAMKDASK